MAPLKTTLRGRLALGGAVTVLVMTIGYGAIAAYLFSNQKAFIFQTPGSTAGVADIHAAMPGSQNVTITTTDGERLSAWYRPPSIDGQPVFLFFHGNIGGLDYARNRWERVFDRGAGALAFSFRGYPGSTGAPSEAGLYEDARAAYRWLRDRHGSDTIVLHGLSLGTGPAAKLATEVDGHALILEAGYTAVSDLAAERYFWLPVHALLTDPFETREIVSKVRMPVMIAHGTRDSIIPFAHAKRLFALAREPKVFVEIANGDHSTLVRDGLYGHVWKFLDGLKP
ncbi:MAG: alpha/beta hydrolase [Pseudomonadota bacterium]